MISAEDLEMLQARELSLEERKDVKRLVTTVQGYKKSKQKMPKKRDSALGDLHTALSVDPLANEPIIESIC